jgi:hypothetical protein
MSSPKRRRLPSGSLRTNSFIFHSRGARGERIFTPAAELGFEGGGGVAGEVEVGAAGVLIVDEHVGLAEVDLEAVAGEKGVAVAVLIGVGGEAEEAVVVHGSGEILDGENGDDAGDGFCGHFR